MKRDNQNICEAYIKQQLRGIHISEPVKLHFAWYEKDKRRDLDNVSSFGRKVVQDALVECGTIDDDGWKQVIGFTDTFFVDRNNPRIEIVLEVGEAGG